MNIKKYIIIIFIIIVILIATRLSISKKETMNPIVIENVGSREIEFTEQSVNTENFDEVLSVLPIPSIDMRDQIQNIAIFVLKEMYKFKDLEEEMLLLSYEINEATFEEYLYNLNLQNFTSIVEKIGELETDNLTYTGSAFDLKTLDVSGADKTVEIEITYNDSHNLNFIVHVDTENNNKILFEFKK